MKNNQTNQHFTKLPFKKSCWGLAIFRDTDSIPSTLPETLINNYLATWYQVWINAALIMLKAGYPSPPLAALLQTTNTHGAAYITACNPGSQIIPPSQNQSATILLYEKLACYSNYIYHGAGIDPAGKWPAEESLLALGIDLLTAKSIGREFGQNAIIWIGSAAIPRLVLLR